MAKYGVGVLQQRLQTAFTRGAVILSNLRNTVDNQTRKLKISKHVMCMTMLSSLVAWLIPLFHLACTAHPRE